jgi:hypothetical protein
MKFKNNFKLLVFLIFVSLISNFTLSQNSNVDTIKAGKFDLGKMWTFEHAPVDYFAEVYNFKPSQEWLDNVRMSALRFGGGCSASFVSEDGLVMTNHHCGRGYVTQVTKEGEELHKFGFWASTLSDERPVKGLYVDQLVQITDVTKDVNSAIDAGNTPEEKQKNRTEKIKDIEKKYSDESKLRCNVVSLYNGSEFMLYSYKRYTDVRLVFAPENLVGFFGGDPDNFTYPRYDFDCTFFRVYEDGKPLKSDHYFKWSSAGASIGEPIFVVGNPGSTERLKTVAQLEFARDYQLPSRLQYFDYMIAVIEKLLKEHPEKSTRYEDMLFGIQNSQKVYIGQIKALNDQILMAKKKDFEKTLKSKVDNNPNLKSKYGNAWYEISNAIDDNKKIFNELIGYEQFPRTASRYMLAAKRIYALAKENKDLPDSLVNSIYNNFDPDYNRAILEFELKLMLDYLGKDNAAYKDAFGNRNAKEAADFILSKSYLTNSEDATNFVHKGYANALVSDDPLIKFISLSSANYDELTKKQKEINAKLEANTVLLGRAIFEVYGTSIPPDATFTLRISDGIIASYSYNGTITPPYTTFYGMYDRYYSFGKQYPWDLPERWANPPSDFKLETPFNFISTCDIIGGNSGSPIINKNAEVVGLAFDGNIESLPGRYIFTTEANRTVAVDSRGLLEAIKDMFKATRLSNELVTGKISE